MGIATISCLVCIVSRGHNGRRYQGLLRTALAPVAVGGNGGNAAASAIQEECEKQGVHTIVAACPKSIDSDILVVSHVSRSLHTTSSLPPVMVLGVHATIKPSGAG